MKVTGRLIAFPMAVAISACVMAAGPVIVYVCPSWPFPKTTFGGDGGDVADVNGAHTGITDGRHELALTSNHRLKREEALEEQVQTQECVGDTQSASAFLHGRVVAQETHRRIFI